MPEKFFDIIPPKKIKKVVAEKKPREAKAVKTNVFLKALVLVVLFLIIAAVPGVFLFSKNKIEVWPKTRTLTLEEEVVVALEDGAITGKIFRDQKSGSQDFPASARAMKEEKAKGIIRVYNSYSADSQSLLAHTRFVSADGKLFKSIKKEVIAGAVYEKGKLVASETEIEVEAAEPGKDYNIGPSTFSIPGFAGTPKYTAFYGKSFSPMTGGIKDEMAQATQDDLDRAREVLAGKLKEESRQFIKAAIPQGFVLLDKAILQEVSKEDYFLSSDSFTLNLEVLSESIIFSQADVESFVEKIIGSNISENEKLQKESLEISYFPIDANEGKIELNLKIKAKIYSDINLDDLKKSVSGLSFQEIKTLLENQPEIAKSEINLGPFWKKRLPEDTNKIKVMLNLD